jgi:membrane protein DedA with SNARE-associated domain
MPIATISSAVTHQIAAHGVYAVFVLMAIDAVFPAASELVMLYAGAIAAGAFSTRASLFGARLHTGLETFLVLAAAGTLGYFAGSLVGWWAGTRGGRPLIERYLPDGRSRLVRAEAWFARWGNAGILLGRLTPIVRSFIAIPAGALGVRFWAYSSLTLIGSAVWAFAFAGAGWALGVRYVRVDHGFRFAEYAVGAVAITVLVSLVGRLLEPQSAKDEQPQ